MTAPTMPVPPSAERLRRAVAERESTDYVFDFWTAFGWMVLTLGLYSFYVFYQLVRRSRDHNRRRADLLDAAYEDAWQRAVARGRADEMRPRFERIAADLDPLRRMAGDFRDPALWTLLNVVGGGLVWLVGVILLDQDLVRHEAREHAVELGLTEVYADLDVPLPSPHPTTKRPHNYVGRIVAAVFSLGVYVLWWLADMMREGNAHFVDGYTWEDAVASSASQA